MFTRAERQKEEKREETKRVNQSRKILLEDSKKRIEGPLQHLYSLYDDLDAAWQGLVDIHDEDFYRLLSRQIKPLGERAREVEETRKAVFADLRRELACFRAVKENDGAAYLKALTSW